MAVTQPSTHDTPMPQQAPRIGRPPGSGPKQRAAAEAQAADTAAAAEAPQPTQPEKKQEVPDDPFVSLLPNLNWERHMIYLYRRAPIIDRKANGKDKYIAKYVEAIDEQTVMTDHGSGRYRLDLLYCPPEGHGKRYVMQHEFSIFNMDYPPKIPAGDWVDDPRNREWAWAKPAALGGPNHYGGGSPQEYAEAITKLIRETRPDLNSQEQGGIMNKVIEMMQKLSDPAQQLLTMEKLLEVARPKDTGETSALMKMLMDDRQAMREELRELRRDANEARKEASNKESKGLLETLIEAEPALEKLGRFFGRGKQNDAGGTTWMDIANKAVEELAPPLGRIAEGVAFRAGLFNRPAPTSQPNSTNKTTITEVPKNAIERRKDARDRTAAAAPANGAPQPAVEMSEEDKQKVFQLWQKFGTIFQQSLPFMMDHYKNLTGYDFRDWFCTRHGLNWWNDLKREVGTEQLMNFAKFDEGLWKAIQPEENFRVFLDQFFTEVGQEPEEFRTAEDDDDTPEPPVKEPRPS